MLYLVITVNRFRSPNAPLIYRPNTGFAFHPHVSGLDDVYHLGTTGVHRKNRLRQADHSFGAFESRIECF